jgi:hypothetical protein
MKLDLSNVALPQEELEVDEVVYMVTAMPATEGLKFMEQHQESIDSGKADLALMKKIICMSVTKDGKMISEKANNSALSFDIVFAKKYGHLRKLYQAILEYNFSDVFQEPDSEE